MGWMVKGRVVSVNLGADISGPQCLGSSSVGLVERKFTVEASK